ncbi:MAG: DUF501 domain-containing protein [Acidobacteria bacterium]|nr:MAG: DUF501 domain-containing protein [Acidobacteriota bacterium]
MAVDPQDSRVVSAQIGRPVRGESTVMSRCDLGLPVVVKVAPLLDDGTPFPTLYWLTCPLASKRVARIESAGGVATYAERADSDPDFAGDLKTAHIEYEAERAELLGMPEASELGESEELARPVPTGGIAGVMKPGSVKCLHAHLAHTLGGGKNPIGSELVREVLPLNCTSPCVVDHDLNPAWREPELSERKPETESDSTTTRVGAIDVGTNSARLLVAELEPAYRPIRREMTITRLGYKVDETGYLDPTAVERTAETISRYASTADALGVEAMRIAATSACRDASNRDEFFARVKVITGVEPEILSGEEEAAIAFLGALSGIEDPGPWLVVDIGGGSTEVVLGEVSGGRLAGEGRAEVTSSISIDMGCVRITERFLKSDPPTSAEKAAATAAIEAGLDSAEKVVDVSSASKVIGVAGTVTTLASIGLGLTDYDPSKTHHYQLPAREVRRLYEALGAMTAAERVEKFGVLPGRADVIVAGSMILLAVLERWGFDSVLVSESDILDGLVLSMGGSPHE